MAWMLSFIQQPSKLGNANAAYNIKKKKENNIKRLSFTQQFAKKISKFFC